MSKEYLVQPEQYGERKADYEKGKVINQKWKSISSKKAFELFPNGFNGNVGHHTTVNAKSKEVTLHDEYPDRSKTEVSLSETISAALALYRTICMLDKPKVECQGADGYKVPWSMHILHKETGHVLGISEWKGAFGIWTKFHYTHELPESFKNDIIELLNLMFSDASPHPYDGCTAGIVA